MSYEVEGQIANYELEGRLRLPAGVLALRNGVTPQMLAQTQQGVTGFVLDLRNLSAIDDTGIGELVTNYTDVRSSGARLVYLIRPKQYS